MSKEFAVVKFGSELVTSETGINQAAIDQYAAGLKDSYADNHLVIVTSGAVAAGIRREAGKGRDVTAYPKAVLAQVGSTAILHAWESAFDACGETAGGLLVTHHELDDREEGTSFTRHLHTASDLGIISIINENDALSDAELMALAVGGDNDGLSAHIARSITAESLTLFTKRGGVVDDNGELISRIGGQDIDSVMEMLGRRTNACGSSNGEGRGGIVSKVNAAWSTAQEGISARIAAVNEDMTGADVTEFVAAS